MKPSKPSSSNQLDKDNIRCLNLGMGSSLQQCNDRGTLVPKRSFLSQLPGDVRSLSSTPVLHERPPTSSDSLSLHGQYLNHFLLQLQRRDNITIPLQSSQGDLAMVHVSEHLTSSQLPTRPSQHCSRCRVQYTKGSLGLAITSGNLPQDQPQMGSISSGPLCIQTYSSSPSILQLETRSTGSGNQCLPPDVANNEMLCKSSLGTDVEGPLGDQPSTSRSGDYSVSLEESVMVPSPPLSTIQFPSSDNIPTRSNTFSGVSNTFVLLL